MEKNAMNKLPYVKCLDDAKMLSRELGTIQRRHAAGEPAGARQDRTAQRGTILGKKREKAGAAALSDCRTHFPAR